MIKELSQEETALKEEMKDNCLKKSEYVDEKAKEKFKRSCRLDKFELECWNIEQRFRAVETENIALIRKNRKLKEKINTVLGRINGTLEFAKDYDDLPEKYVDMLESIQEMLKEVNINVGKKSR